MRIWDESGRKLDVTFSVEEGDGGKSVIFHRRGNTRGEPGARNVGFIQAVDLILKRLGQLGFSLTDALLESEQLKSLPAEKRRLDGTTLEYPLKLQEQDIASLATALINARGNNKTRMMRLILAADGTPGRGAALSRGALEVYLSKGTLPSDAQGGGEKQLQPVAENLAADGAFDAAKESDAQGGEEEQLRPVAENLAADGVFDAAKEEDTRQQTLRAIAVRQGQPRFRRELLEAYEGKCAISGCDVTEALEAAHIVPYRGEHTNHVQNGLLLRADLHSLFDLGLLTIDPETWTVIVSPRLHETVYESFDGEKIRLPVSEALRPLLEVLLRHRKWAGLS